MPKKPPTHPLLVRSFQLYRLSPLHNFPSIDPSDHPSPFPPPPPTTTTTTKPPASPFKPHERALSNSLRGDVLRGVNVADEDAGNGGGVGKLSALGRFKACRWRLVPTFSALRDWVDEMGQREDEDDDDDDDDDEDDEEEDEGKRGDRREWQKAVRERRDVAGVEITFEYERGVAGYVAYLLCPPHPPAQPPALSRRKTTTTAAGGGGGGLGVEDAFTQFPLLLARLPKALVEVLFEYLSVTFDTLPLPMGLVGNPSPSGGFDLDHHNHNHTAKTNTTFSSSPSSSSSIGWLGEMLEMYLSHHNSNAGGKDVTMVFRLPGVHGIRTLTISIRAEDVAGFLKYGKAQMSVFDVPEKGGVKRKRGGDGDGVGEREGGRKGPFFTAVRQYVKGTMGMEMDQLVLVKVACAGFVIGGGGGGAVGGERASSTTTAGADSMVKSKPDTESAGASGRIKIFAPRRLRPGESGGDGADDEAGSEHRSGSEIAVERFMESLLELARGKSSVLAMGGGRDGGGGGVAVDTGDGGDGARKKKVGRGTAVVPPTGKVPKGRVMAF